MHTSLFSTPSITKQSTHSLEPRSNLNSTNTRYSIWCWNTQSNSARIIAIGNTCLHQCTQFSEIIPKPKYVLHKHLKNGTLLQYPITSLPRTNTLIVLLAPTLLGNCLLRVQKRKCHNCTLKTTHDTMRKSQQDTTTHTIKNTILVKQPALGEMTAKLGKKLGNDCITKPGPSKNNNKN